MNNLTISTMTREDLDIAIEWAALEGWNPGKYDAESFYAADPNGFFMARLAGEPVGCISAVAYDSEFGFLGFYIVKPEFRKKGIGLDLWHKAMEYLGTRNVGLDGVIAQKQNYVTSGFKFAYSNIRYEGTAKGEESGKVVALSQIPFADIECYDKEIFKSERKVFLEKWLNGPESFALGFVDNGKLTGYGIVRPCRVGYKIGPLFADNEKVASALFNALTNKISGERFYFDVPEINTHAVGIAKNAGMTKVFETARMYTKDIYRLPYRNVYGVTTFELG